MDSIAPAVRLAAPASEATRSPLTFGLPRLRGQPGERRDFLPALVGILAGAGCPVLVESGVGGGLGFTDDDYRAVSPLVRVVDERTAFAQDVVLTLRVPDGRLAWMRRGATLVSMVHFATRPARVARLVELGLGAVSLDSVVDDHGRRLVEDGRAVAWNGLEEAFDVLACTSPLEDPDRGPVRVLVMGAGTIGKHAVEAATKYGSLERDRAFTRMGLPGVVVTVIGRNLTGHAQVVRRLLATTDVLVDATQRSDPARPVVPNTWLAALPANAVICDLVADPYLLDAEPSVVRGIEGIPLGDLEQRTFFPQDPAWERSVPAGIPSRNRRTVVSCGSWPGIHPLESMDHYGRQLAPLLSTLIERGGVDGLRPDAGVWDRALLRAGLGAATESRTGRLAS